MATDDEKEKKRGIDDDDDGSLAEVVNYNWTYSA